MGLYITVLKGQILMFSEAMYHIATRISNLACKPNDRDLP